jgi:probable rRNA maturation factor
MRGGGSSARSARSTRSARPRLALHLQVISRAAPAPASAQVRRWARAALKGPAEITVRIVGAAEARALNRRYRGRDYAANVLSFPYALRRGLLQGDIVLCAPVIAREALAQGKAVQAHLAHLTVHALLHLQGYDHLRRRDSARMEALEKKLLAKLGYPDPYDAPG